MFPDRAAIALLFLPRQRGLPFPSAKIGGGKGAADN
jgi:hypothetical protein